MQFNKVILVGNLVSDPTLKTTANGKSVCDALLAVNNRDKDSKEDTLFMEITFWGRTAEVTAEYCKKGSPILVEGRLKTDRWEKDGEKRSKIVMVGETMQMLSQKSKKEATPEPTSTDDIPY